MRMQEDELMEAIEENSGYCTSCNEITNFGGCEPDARNYECDECHKKTVFGIEEAIISGFIAIA